MEEFYLTGEIVAELNKELVGNPAAGGPIGFWPVTDMDNLGDKAIFVTLDFPAESGAPTVEQDRLAQTIPKGALERFPRLMRHRKMNFECSINGLSRNFDSIGYKRTQIPAAKRSRRRTVEITSARSPQPLETWAKNAIDLQQRRQTADYDPNCEPSAAETQINLRLAKDTVALFENQTSGDKSRPTVDLAFAPRVNT
jgi:hypothetical protein